MPPFRPLVALLVTAGVAFPAAAQKPKVVIEDARIGLPAGRFAGEQTDAQQAAHVCKRNTWAPIYLTLKIEGENVGPARLVIEAADGDDLSTTLSVPLGSFADRKPGELVRPADLPFVPYVRPGGQGSGEVTITVVTDDPDSRPRSLSEPKRAKYQPRDAATYVVAALGSKLPGFALPADTTQPNPSQQARGALRNGRIETAAVLSVRELPDQWLGYAGCDLVVLPTGAAAAGFLEELFGETRDGQPGQVRRAALFEWVRRGGRLVVSVGANAGLLKQYPAFQEILPAPLRADEPSRGVEQLPLEWKIFGNSAVSRVLLQPKGGGTFPVAEVAARPDSPPRFLLPARDDANRPPADPAVVQAPLGLGRVTLVLFDLDRSPFLDAAPGPRGEFWDWLLRTAGAERASAGPPGRENDALGYNSFDTGREDELAGQLRTHIDTFEGVPVISFGWVALFIALYTLLIGPVEYLFLKKVVGRLELTWITFPLIVLSVSAAAYFTAYAIKGRDLRVNKIDVVDVDPAGGRVYGRSWFTLFSPRIDSYTVGAEPRAGWTVPAPGGVEPPTTVDWLAGGGGGGGSIVSRGYSYHTDYRPSAGGRERFADALVGVPIQVWSTKAFAANWSGYTDPAAPLAESDLYHPPGDPSALAGSFLSRLPVRELRDAVLLYEGKAYTLDPVTPGVRVTPVLDPSTAAGNWFGQAAPSAGSGQMVYNRGGMTQSTGPLGSGWGLLFHERSVPRDRALSNSSFRDLDQSWRTGDRPDDVYRDEAILVGRVDGKGSAEDLMTAGDGPAATTLWLRGVPGTGQKREPVQGTLRQETYVRVYLPVRPQPIGANK